MARAAPFCAVYIVFATICVIVLPANTGEKIASGAAGLACLAAAVCLFWTGKRALRGDRLWRFILGTATALTVAVSVWHVRWAIGHGAALPSHVPWSATGFLAILIVCLGGVLAFPTDPLDDGGGGFTVGRNGFHWYAITTLDSLVVVGAMFLLTWSTVLAPAIRTHHLDTPGILSNTGTVLGYLIVIAAILLLSMFRQPRSGLGLGLLGAGFGMLMASTALYLTITAAGKRGIPPIVDSTAAAGWLLILLAALVPVPESPGARRSGSLRTLWMRAALPYLALGAVGLMVIGQLIADDAFDRIERGGLIILPLVVLARQMMTLGENTRLLASVQTSRQQLHYQAFHDPLTGLANRALFTERLQQALSRRDSHPFALVYCDLDDFKRVNDTLGHGAGDTLLKTTAERLRHGVRPGDTVARLGGDEFAILLADGRTNPRTVCRRLAATIRAPTTLAGHTQPVGVSLGLVLADAHSPPGAEALLRDADVAMYAAKREGKGSLVVYRPELATPAAPPRVRADLDHALHTHENRETIDIRYQPVVDLATGDTVALDAVPTWTHRQLGQVAPDTLAQLAQEAGLTRSLSRRVLTQVCADLAARDAPAAPPVFVAVPRGHDLDQATLTDAAQLLADHPPLARAIILTLADTCTVGDLAPAVPLLRHLAERGTRLALGDVGCETSTFAAWHVLPITIISLDSRLSDPGTAPRLRDAILAAANRLGLTTIATGINRRDQARELRAAGCSLATGPLYGPPRTLDQIRPRSVGPTRSVSRLPRAVRPAASIRRPGRNRWSPRR